MKRVFCWCLLFALFLSACAGAPQTADETMTWQEQYDLGVRYLSEGNYEEAIIAFTTAIEIDPKRTEAYVGLADAYVAAGDPAAAVAALEQGVAQAEDTAALEARLAELTQAAEGESAQKDPAVQGTVIEEEAQNVELSTLSVSNVTYRYEAGGQMAELNEGAIGGLSLSFSVDAPENVGEVRIWRSIESPPGLDRGTIGSQIESALQAWHDTPVYAQDVPFTTDGMSLPVYEDELGKNLEVLLIGLDGNMAAVGYAIVTVQLPAA